MPTAQRLVFPLDRAGAPSLDNNDELSDDGHVHIDEDRGSPACQDTSSPAALPSSPVIRTDDPEDNLGPYYHPDYEAIPPQERAAIEQCCRDDFGISSVREFQLQAIYAGAFYDNSFLSINAKTGYGKSLIPLAIATCIKLDLQHNPT